jgi:ABC-type lipoprotein release transport system permease subunit
MFKTKSKKILIMVIWFLFLVVIVMLVYLFISSFFNKEVEDINLEKYPALKIEENKIIEEPSKEKIDNLIEKINKQNIETKNIPENTEHEENID